MDRILGTLLHLCGAQNDDLICPLTHHQHHWGVQCLAQGLLVITTDSCKSKAEPHKYLCIYRETHICVNGALGMSKVGTGTRTTGPSVIGLPAVPQWFSEAVKMHAVIKKTKQNAYIEHRAGCVLHSGQLLQVLVE